MYKDATATMKAKMKHQTKHRKNQDKQVRDLLIKFRKGDSLTETKKTKPKEGLKTGISGTIQQQLRELRLILKEIK